jgi:RNA polymerase sigma-70 factor (ECF subfamily)
MSRAVDETPDEVSLRVVSAATPAVELVTATGLPELAVLIHRSGIADEAAFTELYDATASRVYGLAARVLRSPALAEEVALETYLEVWRKSARFDAERSSPIGWMLAIVLRRVVDRLGSAGDAVRDSSYVPVRALGHDIAAPSEEAAQILEALACLGPGQLDVLELACREGGDAETVHLTTILSTLVDASLWEGLRRMDGTTYPGSLEPAPGRPAAPGQAT